jgi:hypothetical protein
METQSNPVWGAPQTEPAHWSWAKTLAAVAVALVLAAGGAAVIHAAAGTTEQAGRPGFGGPPPGGFGAGPQFDAPAALHGEFVVDDGMGGYATELTQTGVVTDISADAVTARSADGFTRTYTITEQTRQGREPVQRGDTATIRAVAGGGTDTATVISPAE